MPERFQDTTKEFDVIFTAEERIYDAVVESKQYIVCSVLHMLLYCIKLPNAELESLGSTSFRPVHVVNLEIKDNHEDATLGAFLILKLCNMVRTPHKTQCSCILVQE